MLKSNMFMAMMALCLNPSLVQYFEDFLCSGYPLHGGEISSEVDHYLYIDDASFSGSQMENNIMILGGRVDNIPNTIKVHIVVLYISETGKRVVMRASRGLFNEDVNWYTTDTVPGSVGNIYNSDQMVDTTDFIRIAALFLRGSNKHDDFQKSLFYTDLKIADTVSIYPLFLLKPIILKDDMSSIYFGKNIVSNCRLPSSDHEEDLVKKGTYCPISIYKRQEWQDFVSKEL
jgi:hypothetical protein